MVNIIFLTYIIKNNAALTFTLQAMALLEIQLNIVPKTKRAITFLDNLFIIFYLKIIHN